MNVIGPAQSSNHSCIVCEAIDGHFAKIEYLKFYVDFDGYFFE